MKKIFSLLFTLLTTTMGMSQGMEQAKGLLEQVTQNMKKKDNIRFEFSYVLENKTEQIRQELEGEVTLAGDQYKVNFMDAIQLFDGKKIYTIVPENEEITISFPDDEDDLSVNPSKLLNFYEEGYGYEWDIEQRVMGRVIQYVKLLPNPASEEVNYLLLGIDTQRLEVYRVIEIGYNNTRTTLTLSNTTHNIQLPDDFFAFDAAEYPNFYIDE